MGKKTSNVPEAEDEETLSEADRRALRGSRFVPLPLQGQSQPKPQPRLAHPGGPVATNKAAALAKFLERKLQQPCGLSSINPDHLQVAVENAKDTLRASNSGASTSGRIICHVTSFGDSSEELDQSEGESKEMAVQIKKKKHKKQPNRKTKKEIDQSEGESNEMKEEMKIKKHRKQQKKRKKEKTLDTGIGKVSKHRKKLKKQKS